MFHFPRTVPFLGASLNVLVNSFRFLFFRIRPTISHFHLVIRKFTQNDVRCLGAKLSYTTRLAYKRDKKKSAFLIGRQNTFVNIALILISQGARISVTALRSVVIYKTSFSWTGARYFTDTLNCSSASISGQTARFSRRPASHKTSFNETCR